MADARIIDGRFRLGALIGEGGIGQVFEATDLTTGAPCAVKLVRPQSAREARIRRRFMREARAVSRLAHPNIVKMLTFGVADDQPYIAMERLHGPALGAFREGPADLRLILELVDQCLAALAYSHARGVIHRDFKPDNVLVVDGPGGPRVKLLDFGFARVEEDDDPDLTQVHRDTFGTPDYMAPEQANGDGPIGPPTDLYAVGAVLYELLSGQPPFTGPTAMAVVFKQIMEAVPPLVPRAGLTLPAGLPEVVGKALAKAPRARFQTANDMRRALAALVGRAAGPLDAVPSALPVEDDSTLVGVPAHSPAVAVPRTQDITGRDAEMDWLWQHVHTACAHREGRVVLLGGAPGLGRTALTDWLAGLVAEGGWMQVVRGAPGVDAELGHGLLRAGLAQLFGGLPPGVESAREAIGQTVARWQAARGPVPAARAQAERAALVALADYVLPEPGTPQALQGEQLFARVGDALALAAAERPVLWLLDRDEALGPVMARFVAWAARALAATPWPLLVVVSHPVDPVGRPLGDGPVAGLVDEVGLLGSVARRVLTPLGHGVLAQLLVDEHGLAGELAHVLARASAGNLRLALVLAEVLQQRRALMRGASGWTLGPGADPTSWPTTLADAEVAWVLGRLATLPDPALAERTLCAAAVLGYAVDYGLLVDCVVRTGADVHRVEQAIEALLQAELLDEVRDWRLDRLYFAHPGRRQACLQAGAQRGQPMAALHRLAAEAREAWLGDHHQAASDELARHFMAAGAPLEAARHLEAAARWVRDTGEADAGVALLEEALALVERLPGREAARRRANVLLALGEAELARGAPKLAQRHAAKVEAWAREARDVTMAARVRSLAAGLLLANDRPDKAQRLFEQAARLFEKVNDPRRQACVQLELADVALEADDTEAAQAAFEQAWHLMSGLGEARWAARAALGLGRLALRRGAAVSAQEHLEHALDGFSRAHDVHGVATSHLLLADVAAQVGPAARLEVHLDEALAAYAAAGDRAGLAEAHRRRALLCAEHGDWAAAGGHLDEAVAHWQALAQPAAIAAAQRALGKAALRADHPERAAPLLEAALAQAVQGEGAASQAALFALAGWAAGAVGAEDDYRARLRRAWQLSRLPDGQGDPDLVFAFEGAGGMAARRGDFKAAARLVRRAARLEARHGDPAEADRLQRQAERLGTGLSTQPPGVPAVDTGPPPIPPPPLAADVADLDEGPGTHELDEGPAWAAPGGLNTDERRQLERPAQVTSGPPPRVSAPPEPVTPEPVAPEPASPTPTRVVEDDSPARPVTGTMVVGRHIGNLRIVAPIASGGMGTVYRAEHTVLGTPYAIKLLHAAFVDDPNTLARFRREAVACSRLRHPNVVFLTDFGVDPDLGLYLVMEYLEGESLAGRLRRIPCLPVGDAVDFALQISRALGVAHGMGVVHRDLKPENLFLVPDGHGGDRVRVLDFGIARLQRAGADDPEHPKLTRAGLVLGTPDYMSPEQINGKDELLGPPTDIYALGAILYQMITGEPPFSGANEFKVLSQHLLNAAPRVGHQREDLANTKIEALVADMLLKTPAGRPVDMAAVAERLEEGLRELRALGVRDAGTVAAPRAVDGDSLLARLHGHDPEGTLAAVMGALPGLAELPLARQQLVLWGVVQRVVLDFTEGTRTFKGATAQMAELLEAALTAGHVDGDEESRDLASRALADVMDRADSSRQKALVLAVQHLRGRPGFPEVALPVWARVSAASPGSSVEMAMGSPPLGLVAPPAPRRKATGERRRPFSMESIRAVLQQDVSLFGRREEPDA